MNITHRWISKMIFTDGPYRPSSISVSFIKLELNYIKTVLFSFYIKTAIKVGLSPSKKIILFASVKAL